MEFSGAKCNNTYMNKFRIREYFRLNWIRIIVGFAIGATLLFGYVAILYSAGNDKNAWNELTSYRDGLSIAGMFLLFFAALSLVSNLGAFNIFSYYPGRKRKENGMKETYAEYTNRKTEQSKKNRLFFLVYVVVGIIYLIPAIILLFITL